MATRTKLSVLAQPAKPSTLDRYSLTKHMMMTWLRYDLKQRFHLNSDRSRLQYIVWYLADHISSRNFEVDLVPADLIAELKRPISAWGPLSTFMFEYWRTRNADDPSRNIQTEEGYLNFVVDYLLAVAPRHPSLREFVPLGAIAEIQKPYFFDGTHHLSRGAACLWRQSACYMEKYPNLSDWRQVESFNFDLICHYVAEQRFPEVVGPEVIRYWAAPIVKSEPRISRLAFALAAMSPRLTQLGSDLDVLAHGDDVCTWFSSVVDAHYPALEAFAPAGQGRIRREPSSDSVSQRRPPREFPVPGSSPGNIDLLLIGPFSAASGLGTGARRSLEALQTINANFRVVDLMFDNPSASLEAIPESLRYSGETPKMTLWHFNAEYLPDVFATYPKLINPNKNIGYFFWETEAMPTAHALACELVDEIWVPSEFVRGCYAPHVGVEVVNVGTAVNIPKLQNPLPRSWFSLGDAFTYMFSFDAHSVIHRKNPAAVVRAFRMAFPKRDEPVLLILKTQNFSDSMWGALFGRNEELFELCDADHRIRFVNQTMSLNELYSLKTGIDCYVSLHRSEGFGYGPAEAMALGKPVVMTDYSANTEFGNADNCLLVRNKLVHVLHTEYLYWTPDMMWADVDVEDAARCMRLVYDDRQLGEKLGAKARETIDRDFSVKAMSEKYQRRLDVLMRE